MEQPSEPDGSSASSVSPPRGLTARRIWFLALAGLVLLGSCRPAEHEDTLSAIKRSGRLVYGSDKEGGGPYVFPDPQNPRGETGFEVELMARIGRELGVRPVFAQGQWDTLLQNLATRRIDAVVNGYEWTTARARDYLATRPYYVYQFQLMVRHGDAITAWRDLAREKPGGGRWRVGVLGGSAAEMFAREHGSDRVEVVSYTSVTEGMLSTANGQLDATLQDLPAARFYRAQYPTLDLVGPPESHGYYVIYVRKDDEKLCGALNRAIDALIRAGTLRQIYERYEIWTDAQEELAHWTPDELPTAGVQESTRGWPLVAKYGESLLAAAAMTVFLSVTSMPLAIVIGLMTALGRLYGPRPLRWFLTGYVEFLRGTPLMLQLFVLFYVVKLPALAAGVGGLAINYSAYEAEIYRAGLQAIPAGQMEAALALGMSRGLALRRVIVPQAVRIVIPPVTNDFIALFKDTSVCSVITLVELSKQYQILANSTGGVIEFALATSVLYLAMSVPLSWFSRWSERMLGNELRKGGAMA